MQNHTEPADARIAMPPQRFTVDPQVKEMERRLRVKARSPLQRIMLALCWTAFPMLILLLSFTVAIAFQSNPVNAIVTGVLGGLALLLAFTVARLFIKAGATHEVEDVNDERKQHKRSIELSRRSALSPGESVIPVLTKEHVEAGVRFDQATTEYGVRWTREEFHAIRSLLLEDISREDAIIKLVTERGMRDTSGIRHALAGMDAVHKPLQDGWL